MMNDNDWIVVKKNNKNSFNPNRVRLKDSEKGKKVVLEKFYNDTQKSLEEIE